MAYLYIIATPIGNLEDITLRALRVLGEVDVIACEDTRITKKLLHKYEIHKQLLSYHSHSGDAKVEKILSLLEDGKSVALVSDSGTPTLSDQGARLVSAVRERLGSSVEITPIPGPSAFAAALSAAGVGASEFLFLGFLPRKKGRKKNFVEIAASKRTVVFYESPHRILKALEALAEVLESGQTVVIARELTKKHEEFVRGSANKVLEYFKNNIGHIRGEFVVIIARV